jgi:hypothetical protein
MKENVATIGTGVIGTVLVQGAEAVQTIGPEEISTLGQLLIQLAIGIATIWKIIKKPKNNNGNNTGNEIA